MLNFLGVCSHFSVLTGEPWDCCFRFFDEMSGERESLDGVTFQGWVQAGNQRLDMTFTMSEAEENAVQVRVPALPAGRWPYEIRAAAETGEPQRLLYGCVTAEGSADEAEKVCYDGRTLSLILPGDATRHLRAQWQNNAAAAAAAEDARKAAKDAEEARKSAALAKNEAEEAARKLDNVDDAVAAAHEATEKATELKDEAQEILDNLPRQFIPTIVNGEWYINGQPTGVRAKGEDGADGATVHRHLVQRVDDIPQSGATCNGSHLYYVPTGEDGKWHVYAWLEGAGWVKIEADGSHAPVETIGSATYWVPGAVMLGTADVVENGIPVGTDSAGRLMAAGIPHATLNSYGTVRLGSAIIERARSPYLLGIGTTSDGQLAMNLLMAGALKYQRKANWKSADSRLPDNVFVNAESYMLGLHLSTSFSQSPEVGLTLETASETVLGGVRMTDDPEDEEPGKVLTPDAIKKEYTPRADMSRELLNYIRVNETLMQIKVLSREDYDALEHLDAHTLYLVY